MNELFTIENLRLIFTIISLMFGVWQYRQRKKVEKIIAAEAIELHNNIAVALGAADRAIEAIATNGNVSIQVGRNHGICQAVLHESAKIYCNIKNTTTDDIDDLISNNQLHDNYRDIYYTYSNSRGGLLTQIVRWFKKLI